MAEAANAPTPLTTRRAIIVGLATPAISLIVFAAVFAVGYVPAASWADNQGDEDAIFAATVFLFLVALAAHTIACLVVAWRFRRRDGFGRLAMFALGLWFAGGFVAAFFVEVIGFDGGYSYLWLIGGLFAGLALFCGWLFLAIRRGREAIGAVVAAVVLTVGFGWVGALNATDHAIEQLERREIPLALVDEDRLGDLLPGWSLESYGRSQQATLRSDADVEVEVRFRHYHGGCNERWDICVPLEPLSDGSLVEGSINEGNCDNVHARVHFEASVPRPSGGWNVHVRWPSCERPENYPTMEELALVLETLEPTTARVWYETVQAVE